VKRKTQALVIDPRDTVATALEPLDKGDIVVVEISGHYIDIEVVSNIPQGHKISIVDIDEGQQILKYGETIGLASMFITKGDHVHTHNVVNCSQRS
jgi:altronate dehydratase small subunit